MNDTSIMSLSAILVILLLFILLLCIPTFLYIFDYTKAGHVSLSCILVLLSILGIRSCSPKDDYSGHMIPSGTRCTICNEVLQDELTKIDRYGKVQVYCMKTKDGRLMHESCYQKLKESEEKLKITVKEKQPRQKKSWIAIGVFSGLLTQLIIVIFRRLMRNSITIKEN